MMANAVEQGAITLPLEAIIKRDVRPHGSIKNWVRWPLLEAFQLLRQRRDRRINMGV